MEKEFATGERRLKQCLRRTGVMTAMAAIIYYLPTIAVMAGWISRDGTLYSLHDYFELDVYALVFFVPVVYAAYTIGIKWALSTALVSMLLLFPYAITRGQWLAILQPTAFAIILAAVGAAISMLQRSDEQRSQRIRELECLDNVGKASERSESADSFLELCPGIIAEALSQDVGVIISHRGRTFQSGSAEKADSVIGAVMTVGEESVGRLDISSSSNLKGRQAFVAALAGRIGGAIHEIELQESLNSYYQQLEDLVEKRTKELERAQEKLIRSERLAAVGELASAVSHELRNPLNVIKNCVYLLNMSLEDERTATEETRDILKMINQQVNISNRIVTDLLDFTRPKMPLVAGTDLKSLVEQSISWLAIPPEITISRNFGTNGSRVLIDADQIGRAFANILSNAIQAIGGAGEIRISSAITGDFASINFEDTGCGIPPENLDRIFEPLFTTKPKGTGLGLAITKKLVEQNGGTVAVTSEVSKGTTFSVNLPLEGKETNFNAKPA